ncbi:hypothetical protein GGTG_01944 [Gaeumannomyces tritici R3-111a-1]|uniref:Uncharacterized protein n=1 Tax=Gaeumannomyces tritici (strain R3-111a-1) TaxID=644352 RepID=J3NL03_GAET3|nr:hypothetical protein GGTG_01944 [Gaeumannomyces tritici R3-111a-1]EJT81970.1 hypothetical protein GGTG_01944 [Gaeumannomyces tritici R3-111a-1]
MQEPGTAPWDLGISDADFEKLTAGFAPKDMDDRWRGSDPDGNISIRIIQLLHPEGALRAGC